MAEDDVAGANADRVMHSSLDISVEFVADDAVALGPCFAMPAGCGNVVSELLSIQRFRVLEDAVLGVGQSRLGHANNVIPVLDFLKSSTNFEF